MSDCVQWEGVKGWIHSIDTQRNIFSHLPELIPCHAIGLEVYFGAFQIFVSETAAAAPQTASEL